MPMYNLIDLNLILTWSSTCVITNSTGAGTFEITDTKLYVSVVTLSIQDILSCFSNESLALKE